MKIIIVPLTLLLAGCVSSVYNYPAHIQTAYEYLGYTERDHRVELTQFLGVNPRRTEWCAAFVNGILEENNYASTRTNGSPHYLLARSYLEYGDMILQAEVQNGDIMIFTRGRSGWQGHVGFYVGQEFINGVLYYRVLGGNQSNEVNITLFPEHKLLGIRRPVRHSV